MMRVVLPIMAFIVAPRLHKNTWQDIKDLNKSENKTKFYMQLVVAYFYFALSCVCM